MIIDCCACCKHLVGTPKNNRYGDIEYFCMKTGYYAHGINRDIHTVERYTPGGKKLTCEFERKYDEDRKICRT